jgi:hypothetical protein
MSSMAVRAFSYWSYTAMKTWRLTFFVNVVTPVMFLAALGLGLGTLVDRKGGVSGASYVDFLAPGRRHGLPDRGQRGDLSGDGVDPLDAHL